MTLRPIDVAEARKLIGSGEALLVDVREPDEHAREHVPGARSLPLSKVEAGAIDDDGRMVIYQCASGNRTRVHAARLAAAGPASARVLDGGLAAWKRAGGSTTVDRHRPIEIMRQVQIVAGSLVVAGVVLSLTVSPLFVGLSAFVGAGLATAGVTGFCGMARVLARMPWNRPPSGGPTVPTAA